MQVEILNERLASYSPPRTGTVLKWGSEDTVISETNTVCVIDTLRLRVIPALDRGSSEETNRVLSVIAGCLDCISDQLESIARSLP